MLVDRTEETKAGGERSKRLACIPEELGPALVSDSTEIKSRRLILKEINPVYSLEGLMLKLKLKYFRHLIQRANPWKRS